jgi:APA family basic amino acid/polyamine antiporter
VASHPSDGGSDRSAGARPSQPSLSRRLSTGDAVVVGLSAMIGAGVFSVWGPAAAAAGSAMLLALGLAAVVALCNATSSAQLAAHHPASGGTYVFGRRVLGPWWGFVAGWGFVIGKTASCAAMALTFAAYLVPDDGAVRRGVAAAAVAILTLAAVRGITRTAQVARVLLVLALVGLVWLLLATASSPASATADLAPPTGAYGVLQGAGLLFFAFAGYARIATLAEEVRSPATIGRAVLIALSVALALYILVGASVVAVLGGDLPVATAPLADVADALSTPGLGVAVRIAAVAAALGALLALLTGVSRTTLAMAREADLPRSLAAVEPRHRVPARAQLLLGLVVVVVVLATDLRAAIGFSSFGVLVYYAVANLAALRQPPEQRRWPRPMQVLGLVGCVVMALSLPLGSVLGGLAVLAVGVGYRMLRLHRRAGPERASG